MVQSLLQKLIKKQVKVSLKPNFFKAIPFLLLLIFTIIILVAVIKLILQKTQGTQVNILNDGDTAKVEIENMYFYENLAIAPDFSLPTPTSVGQTVSISNPKALFDSRMFGNTIINGVLSNGSSTTLQDNSNILFVSTDVCPSTPLCWKEIGRNKVRSTIITSQAGPTINSVTVAGGFLLVNFSKYTGALVLTHYRLYVTTVRKKTSYPIIILDDPGSPTLTGSYNLNGATTGTFYVYVSSFFQTGESLMTEFIKTL